MPIRQTTNTCTVGQRFTSLEHLLVATTAALVDETVDFVVSNSADDNNNNHNNNKLILEQVTTDAWTTATTHTTSMGWMGATRALVLGTTAGDAVAESWLEAADQTFVVAYQAQDQTKNDVFAAACEDLLTKIDQHLTTTQETYLTGDTPSITDAVVVLAAAAAMEKWRLVGATALPPRAATWMQSILQKLQTTLPYLVIPGWREFGLERCDCWARWSDSIAAAAGATAAAGEAAATPAAATVTSPAAPAATTTDVPITYEAAPVDADNLIIQKLQAFVPAADYIVYQHEACTTAEDLVAKVPLPPQQSHTKNLFLRDKKHGHYLITVDPTSGVNTKELGKLLNLAGKVNLRLADEALLDAKLKVKPGCVGPLGMALAEPTDDAAEKVNFVLDAKLLTYDKIHSHPLRNDQSVSMTPATLQSYLKQAGVEPIILDFPVQGTKPSVAEGGGAKKDASAAGPSKKDKKDAPKKAGAVVKKDAGKKGETKLALQFKKNENFAQWYADVIVLSEMISYYDISGCYILRPWSYKMWELVQEWFNVQIQALGVENSYFPMFVSQERLEKEKDHVEGFAPEVAWVTRSGDGELARPIAVRPTSETIMYPAFADWIQSHRDLPLKLNQWSNVVRWEFKYPTPFLRTREFLWQEGHTAHATFEEAEKMVMQALELYRQVYEDLMAVPVVPGYKTEKEKFAGGFRTTTVEAYVAGSGRAIQGATSHHLGQNFGKMFGITFQNEKGVTETAWQTSWGLTTRTIGVMVMVHGDDKGLVLPPRIAPLHAVIVPIVSKKFMPEEANPYCEAILKDLVASGMRAKYDDRTIYNPGWKYNHWEQRGVPIRIEVGPRDVEGKKARIVLRYNGESWDAPIEGLGAALVAKLDEIQANMFSKAKEDRDAHIVRVTEWKDFVPNLEKNNLVLTPWCGGEHSEWEEHVKEKSREESLKARGEEAEDDKTSTSVAAKSLCIPFDQPELPPGTKCLVSGLDATCWILWGRSY
uniref:proline--tRNA ligase n=2 Tax=Amphora coffeiformis TaxID=265554 RepID=A0A7S3L317_9STRA|mmetsp:Transcript_15761/g.29803  ORF Transcript_15761/g.29803 Transcript_15761/m.29803 type:complete len:989 (-) Transcript_15761:289-3255(-)